MIRTVALITHDLNNLSDYLGLLLLASSYSPTWATPRDISKCFGYSSLISRGENKKSPPIEMNFLKSNWFNLYFDQFNKTIP
nr:MAG TPA: hypothetical protein [Caudoviricetes sp.]